MSSKSKIIIIILSFFITIGIMTGIVLPTAKKIKLVEEDIYNQRMALEKLYLRGQSMRKSRLDYETIKEQIKTLNNVFNQQGEELEFITSLEKIAEKQNVKQVIKIENNEKNEKTEIGGCRIIRVEVNLTGTFPNIMAYLAQVQTLDYYFNIDSLNFYVGEARPFEQNGQFPSATKGLKKSTASPSINATLSGLTYWR